MTEAAPSCTASRSRLAVAACRQGECAANCVIILQPASLRLGRPLGLVGNGLFLRRLALRVLIFRRPNRRGDRCAPLSIGGTRSYRCHGCSRQRFQSRQRFDFRRNFNRQAIGLCRFGFGCGSHIGERRQPVRFRQSFLNRICGRCTIGLRTSVDRGVGEIEMTKSKPERTYPGQDNKKCQAEPNSPDHIEPPLAGSIASGRLPQKIETRPVGADDLLTQG